MRRDNNHTELNFIDLFSGAGGFSAGFELAGFRALWANDFISKFCETYKANHPHTIVREGDITKISVSSIKKDIGKRKVNLVIGGPPCQGFSHAGLRDPKDPRNSLFMDFVRIVEGLKPDYFVMENVPGLLTMTTSEGKKVVDIIEHEFKKIKYKLKWKKLIAADYGVPQKRKRVIFIGTKDSARNHLSITFPTPTHKEEIRETLFEDKLESWVPVKEVLLPKNKVPESYFHTPRMLEGFRKRAKSNKEKGNGFGWQILDPEKPSYTISARYWKDGSDALVKYTDHEIRMLTPRECANIQTFPHDYIFKGSKRDQYTQIGNAIPSLLAKAIAEEIKRNLIPPILK